MANVKGIFLWETISAPEWLIKRRLWPYMFAIRFCSRIISVSEATARFLNKKRHVPAHKIRVIPYGVDLKKYKVDNNSEIRKKMGLNGQNLVIGVVGRLHPQKGHIYLIEASERIIKEFPEVKFVFAGDGALREELEKRIQDKNLEKNFLLLGYRSDIPEVLKSLDVFVLPSLYEGLPNVVLEAMAAGKPVVATSVDGTVEAVVNNVTGFLIPPINIEALQNAILKVLRNKEMANQMGRKGRERVEEHFSLEKQVQSFEKLYSSIVQ